MNATQLLERVDDRELRRRMRAATLLGALAALSGAALIAAATYLIARAAERPPLLELTLSIVAVRTFAITRAAARYGERLATHDAALGALARLRSALFEWIEPLSPGALGDRTSAGLLSRAVEDVEGVGDVIVRSRVPGRVALIAAAACLITVLAVVPVAGLVLAAVVVLAGMAGVGLARAGTASRDAVVAAPRDEFAREALDLIDGLPDLVAHDRAAARLERVLEAEARLGETERDAANGVSNGTGLLGAAAGVAVVAVLLLGAGALERGRLNPLMLGVLAVVAWAAFDALAVVPAAAAFARSGEGSIRRLIDLADAPAPLVEIPARAARPPGLRAELESVRSRYSDSGPWVLDGFDLSFGHGRRVALVGSSGAGKTTAANLLLRFRDPDEGRVLIDGVDARTLDLDDVRASIGLVPEDPFLFSGTIEDNIRMAAPEATDVEVAAAAEAAYLGPWIATLPDGLRTRVGEEGRSISAGQRRRVALARALLADRRLLIADEPFADLDAEAAGEVLRALLAATEGRGLLLITHVPLGLEQMDEVVLLEGGRARSPRLGD